VSGMYYESSSLRRQNAHLIHTSELRQSTGLFHIFEYFTCVYASLRLLEKLNGPAVSALWLTIAEIKLFGPPLDG
jgi:hypothetical protein